ncbi:hypothetical protein HHK36_005692 [Tetracentron sinense]|uniref:Uncharacterized protein n=1 Tax=Tetracentron sinense TaxID=13715 RepID=A0A834ZLG5_TETSI|nr:hypothetical protein HHK36_005692 [Tetracentron sinense]
MEKPKPQTISPSSSGRRSYDSNSPEFEFWMVRNPSFPQPNLVSADELFVDGVLLPLHLLPNHSDQPDSASKPTPEIPSLEPESEPGPGTESSTVAPEPSTVLSTSKRWRDIFKIGEKKRTTNSNNQEDKGKEKKSGRKSSSRVSAAELNISLWPFSRSRSAGNSGDRPKITVGTAGNRKVSSAPCSRSNSAGESKSRKWPSSPSRGGVHLSKTNRVWQARRGGSGMRSPEPVVRNADKGVRKEGLESRRSKSGGGGATTRVLNLNVPMCIGYRHHLSCRSFESSAVGGGGGSGSQSRGGGGTGAGNGGNLFNLRTLFSKKVF